MAQVKLLKTSILSKLLDDEPDKIRESQLSMPEQIQKIKDQVKNDLTELLNTRKSIIAWDEEEAQELNNSLLNYGVEDFMQLRLNATQDTNKLCQNMAAAIESHEPRLKKVEVEPIEQQGTKDKLHFRIHAALIVEPLDELVMFESVLRVKTGDISVV